MRKRINNFYGSKILSCFYRVCYSYLFNVVNETNCNVCITLTKNLYMNSIEKKLVCDDCYMTKLTFFESEVALPVAVDHIVTKYLYYTLKLTSLDWSLCDTKIFYMWQRADLCLTWAKRLITLYELEALYNDVNSEATTIIYNNE